jgi:iron(III) transport system substrate-binding protein
MYWSKLIKPALLAAALTIAVPVLAQDTSLLSYQGPDRHEKLVAAAKKEGGLTLYTAFRPADLPKIIEPFEKKYGIKVTAWRSGSGNVLQRVIKESAGNRNEVDAIMIPSPDMEALRREKLLQPAVSSYAKDLIPGAVPPHQEWGTVLLNVLVQAYNTNLIKKEELPKTYQDLLDPKWKGKLGVEAKLEEWYMALVTSMGEEKGTKFFNDLVTRNGISVRQGMSLLNNMVISGEVPLALAVYRDLPEKGKLKGAPIDWFALDPVIAQQFVVSVAKRAPHPNAAMLFHDYMLSEETQKLLASLYFYPTNSKVPAPLSGARMKLVDPVFAVDNYERSTKSFEDVVTKRAQ